MDYTVLITIGIQTITFICLGVYTFTNFKRDIKDLKSDTTGINGKVNQVENTLIDVTSFIKELSTHMKDGDFSVPSSLKSFDQLYKANSPVRLTSKGHELLNEIGFVKVFNENRDKILFDIKDKLTDKKGEIDFFYFAEKYSIDEVKELYKKESHILQPIRVYMFSKGKSDEKDILLNAVGYYLRDEVIKDLEKWEEFELIKDSK